MKRLTNAEIEKIIANSDWDSPLSFSQSEVNNEINRQNNVKTWLCLACGSNNYDDEVACYYCGQAR